MKGKQIVLIENQKTGERWYEPEGKRSVPYYQRRAFEARRRMNGGGVGIRLYTKHPFWTKAYPAWVGEKAYARLTKLVKGNEADYLKPVRKSTRFIDN